MADKLLTVDDTLDDEDYEEFGLLHENAAEWDLPWIGQPTVARREVELASGQSLSYIAWGTDEPELVFLHGGGQNAHTWDTVILALGRPAVAIDLPGHGRSSTRPDRNYGPWRNVEALEVALPKIAARTEAVVGMSLGGATTTLLAAVRPDLCPKAVIVDVTPQINDPTREMTTQERGSVALMGGPPTYDSFQEMADAAVALSPFRAASGVRRGVRHNSVRLPDGRWRWRYDLFGPRGDGQENPENWADFTAMWDDVSRITVPAMFLRGGLSKYVKDEDIEEMTRRLPSLRVEVVEGAGHAIQSDQPLRMVELIEDFVFGETPVDR
jgi:pimeloyl-ACP methyl ester carboxylesterase